MVGEMRAKLNGVFTGIVEELGEVVGKEELTDAARFVIRGPVVTADAGHGDSIAVNGVCLTVVEVLPDGQFSADVMAETLNRSSLARLEVGGRGSTWNGPPRSTAGSAATSCRATSTAPGRCCRAPRRSTGRSCGSRCPTTLSRYVVEKGSITVDGISLTVSGLGADESGDWFEVSLIPTTLELTTLGGAPVGTPVNLEVDVIAKYVERLLQAK